MPDLGATVVRGHLQTASIKFQNQAYRALDVFPKIVLPTNKTKVTTFLRGAQFRDEANVRARGTITEHHDYKTTETNVDTKQYAFKHKITKEDLRDANIAGVETPPVKLRQYAIETNADKLMLKRERVIETLVTDGTWVDGTSGGEDAAAGWTASSSNTFLPDIDNGIQTLIKNGVPVDGLRLAMDVKTGMAVKRISEVTAALSYSGTVATRMPSLLVSEQALADLLGIEMVIIPRAIYSTADELATALDMTGAYIWDGANAKGFGFLYHFPKRVGLGTMAAGFTAYTKMENGQERATYEWYSKDSHSWMYETQEEYGGVQIAAQAGYLWKDTHTT